MLDKAYNKGAILALDEILEKVAVDWEEVGDVAAPLAGAFNPVISGLVSGATDPGERSLQTGVLTGLGSLGGTALGGLLGAGAGLGAGRLAQLAGLEDVDPRMVATLLGSTGAMAGGAAASHFARENSKNNQTAKKSKKK